MSWWGRREWVAVFVVLLSVSAARGQAPRFRLVPLSGRDGAEWGGYAYSINDYGQVVGSFGPGAEGPRAGQYFSLWTPDTPLGRTGTFTTLPQFPRGPVDGWANGINNAGQVVGVARAGAGDRAFLWTPQSPNGATGTGVDLGGLPAGADSNSAWGVNSYGQVSGHSASYPGATTPATTRGFVFRPDVPNGAAGALTDLGQLPGGTNDTYVHGINDYGQVVGGSTTANGMHAFLWTPFSRNGAAGTLTDLGDLPGSNESAVALAVNASGQVVGSGMVADGPAGGATHAFRWRPSSANGTAGAMKDLGTLGGTHTNSGASAVNDAGWVVGTSAEVSGEVRAVLWTADDRIHDLNALLDEPAPGWSLVEARALNNHGYVAGWAVYDADNNPATANYVRPYLLVPVPEPTGAAAVLLALAPALLKRRRGR